MRNRVIRLPACPVPDYRPRTNPLAGVALIAALGSLASCTTLGTNIRGSFSCGAADGGSCAPATLIDDKAIAEITGDVSYRAAGPYPAPVRPVAPQRVAYVSGPAVEASPQKVLRIVFPAHVDALGRFHETAVVRAVVDSGQWITATNGHGPGLAATSTLNVSSEILSQLGAPDPAQGDRLSSLEPAGSSVAGAGVPSVAAVAAARAKARGATTPIATTSPAPVNRPATFVPPVED